MRGKHGQAAAVRHEVQSRDAEIATYQRAVARLTAERDDARRQLRAEQQRHRGVERDLRARIEHAASPQVEALKLTVIKRTEERDAARAHEKEIAKLWDKAVGRLIDHFQKEHHLRGATGIEAAMEMLGRKLRLVLDGNLAKRSIADDEHVAAALIAKQERGQMVSATGRGAR